VKAELARGPRLLGVGGEKNESELGEENPAFEKIVLILRRAIANNLRGLTGNRGLKHKKTRGYEHSGPGTDK